MGEKAYIVFDFDHTLYSKDCTISFHRFMLGKRPMLFFHLPLQVLYYVCWKLSVISTTRFKEKYLSFLNGIGPGELDLLIAEFWETQSPEDFNQPVNDVLKQHIDKGNTCVVITASPQVIVSYIVKQLYGIDCIGTLLTHSGNTYRIQGENCKGIEKVRRFEKEYRTGAVIKEAYSDNASDKFLFEKAQHAFRIAGEKIIPVK